MPKRAGDWGRVARLVLASRVAIERNREKFADSIKMSSRTIADLERGRRDSYGDGTLALLEHALKWQPGSIERILDGGDPIPAETSTDPRLRRARMEILESEAIPAEQKRRILAEMDARYPPPPPAAGEAAG